ncbi:hypothetical protein [Allochromatium palmeri]|uniref:hypothetical protein n=1 Tax=Allochromatium palmeri TaxID=231048 RepID=UPI0016433721|nr:hypothetical protein [Allochromatium palmeri]
MPLQNRVDPWGNLIAVEARGAWMGNRGILHDSQRQIIAPWKHKAWVTCQLEYQGRPPGPAGRRRDRSRRSLTLKFSALPKPMPVKSGMKIGIQTDSALVVATLPPKAWKKLEKAQTEWPQWVAALTGKLRTRAGADCEAVVVLEQPALQVFEKTAKL